MRLAQLRRAKWWTQAQLGKRVGLGKQMIAHIECGRRRPSKKRADKIAAVLGEPIERLLEYVEVPA